MHIMGNSVMAYMDLTQLLIIESNSLQLRSNLLALLNTTLPELERERGRGREGREEGREGEGRRGEGRGGEGRGGGGREGEEGEKDGGKKGEEKEIQLHRRQRPYHVTQLLSHNHPPLGVQLDQFITWDNCAYTFPLSK